MPIKHLVFDTEINEASKDAFKTAILSNVDATEWHVYLSTPGGNPSYAVGLYKFLKSIKVPKIVYNIDTTYSAGLYFFIGFDIRYSSPSSTFLLHELSFKNLLPIQYTLKDLDNARTNFLESKKKYSEIVAKETNISIDQYEDICKLNTYISDAESVKLGISNEIKELPNLHIEDIIIINSKTIKSNLTESVK